ncbi:MAG: hypothetical protein RMA76_18880 [Deltaproteobacteria bacterium]
MTNTNSTPRGVLTALAATAIPIGAFALLLPETLLVEVKAAAAASSAVAMARTVGVLLLAVGTLNLMVRNHPPSPTLRVVLWADLLLQVLILPLDPLAYVEGAFGTAGAFVPNTVLHVVLIAWLAVQVRRARTWG